MKFNNKLSAAVVTTLALGSTSVLAQEGLYVGAGASYIKADGEADNDIDLAAGQLKIGGYFAPYMGAELRLGTGFSEDEGADDEDRDLKLLVGLLLKGGYQVGSFYPHALLGLTRTDFECSSPCSSDADTDFSYGLGVDIDVSENYKVNVEYLNLRSGEDGADFDEVHSLTVGFTRKIAL